MTARRLQTRNRDLLTRYDTLWDELLLVWAGAPIDDEWWHRRLSDLRSRAESLFSGYDSPEAAACFRLIDDLDRDLTTLRDVIGHFGHDVVTRAYLDSNPIRDNDS